MKKVIAIAVFATATIAANAQSSNQSESASQTVNLKLDNAIEITFTGSGNKTGADVNIPFNSVNDYASGVESKDQQLKVRSNKDFDVTVKANASDFTYSGNTNPAPVMPVKGVLNLMVSNNSTGGSIVAPFSATAFNSLTNTDQDLIKSGSRGGNQTFAIKYKATPGFNYPAGTYSVDVVYTATQK